MASDIVRLYVALLSQFFTLSDAAVSSPRNDASSSGGAAAVALPSFMPRRAHSLASAHYLTRVLSEIQECVNETIIMDISPDASSGLKSLLDSARWRFEGAIIAVWLRGMFLVSITFHMVRIY